ncbi:MAG: 16S rRNA (uracil(1498)-N(3))-methyltransferase [Lachnospiraceae bacterium]|nr:16S rRNA (uracil(1498)-N(3))-methyltransferase [Lachnospiraceae bacterium]
MNRFFTGETPEDGKIRITGSDVNHIKNVLRMQPGDRILVNNGHETEYSGRILEINKEDVLVEITDERPTDTELPVKIYLYQGLPKKDKMELIVQKSVELGAYAIVPVEMKRCVVKLEDAKKEEKKLERWQTIAKSASEQSTRGMIPEVCHAKKYKEAMEEALKAGDVIIPYENAEGITALKNVLASLKEKVKDNKSDEKPVLSVFIGPEGGFDEAEIEYALERGAKTVSLGKRILRTETAGLTTLSIIMYELES